MARKAKSTTLEPEMSDVGASPIEAAAIAIMSLPTRTTPKAFVDIHAHLAAEGVALSDALRAASAIEIACRPPNPLLWLKALASIQEHRFRGLRATLRRDIRDSIKAVDLKSLVLPARNRASRARSLSVVAERVIWFAPPKVSLSRSTFFLSHVMTYGTLDDVLTVQQHFTPDDFREALENAPPGVFDPRSWNYWNLVCGREPVPPMPKRKIPGVDPKDIPDLDPRWSR